MISPVIDKYATETPTYYNIIILSEEIKIGEDRRVLFIWKKPVSVVYSYTFDVWCKLLYAQEPFLTDWFL